VIWALMDKGMINNKKKRIVGFIFASPFKSNYRDYISAILIVSFQSNSFFPFNFF